MDCIRVAYYLPSSSANFAKPGHFAGGPCTGFLYKGTSALSANADCSRQFGGCEDLEQRSQPRADFDVEHAARRKVIEDRRVTL